MFKTIVLIGFHISILFSFANSDHFERHLANVSIAIDHQNLLETNKCEKISIGMCKDVGYITTEFPNYLNHPNQDEAGYEIHQFWPLVDMQCSVHLKSFLCSLYVPQCSTNTNGSKLLPCREICEKSRTGCQPLLEHYYFTWPESFKCEHFPSAIDDNCFGIEISQKKNISAIVNPIKEQNQLESNKCENISIKICKDVGYNTTEFPNYLNHTNQDEAGYEIRQFWPLVELQCSVHLKPFLCSLYAPQCSTNTNGSKLLPCREICEKSRTGCQPILEQNFFTWPEYLKCEHFPSAIDGECFGIEFLQKENNSIVINTIEEQNLSDKCEYINIEICTEVGYNSTKFPNYLNHTNQEDASTDIQKFLPLVTMQCSGYLIPFLCSLYTPECLTNTNGTNFLPCRELCEESIRGCQSLFGYYEITWPEVLQCMNFPSAVDGECFGYDIIPVVNKSNITSQIKEHNEADKCEYINIEICSDVGYNTTKFPNYLNHTNQNDAGMEIHQYWPLVTLDCSPYLKPFLCSLYVPQCSKYANESSILPCREICEESRDRCKLAIANYGFTWPTLLDCDHFPKYTEGNCVSRDYLSNLKRSNDLPDDRSLPPVSNTNNTNSVDTAIEEKEASEACEDISIAMCSNIGYNSTSIPNYLNHVSQDEAALELQQYWPLVSIQCSPYLTSLLCSIYAPQCSPDANETKILPCREMCYKAREGCQPVMEQYGVRWPPQFECENFPNINEGYCYGIEYINTNVTAETNQHIENTAKSELTKTICQPLSIEMCLNFGYNTTRLPNFFGESNQTVAEYELQSFIPLIKTHCSPSLDLFLCTLYSPVCIDGQNTELLPCRDLCEESRIGCEPIMNRFGFQWPSKFKCDDFPNRDHSVCIARKTVISISTPKKSSKTIP